MKRVLRAGIAIGVVLALLLGATWLLIALEVRVSLNVFRERVELAVEEAIGRDVEIEGDLSIVPALWPTLGAEGVSIGNPPGIGGERFAEFEHARGRLGLIPLLGGDLLIEEISVSRAQVHLETQEDGRGNWSFAAASGDEAPDEETSSQPDDDDPGAFEIYQVELEEVQLDYLEGSTGQRYALGVEALEASFGDEGARFEIEGEIEGKPFDLRLQSGRVRDLFELDVPWALALEGVVARVPVSGEVVLTQRSEESQVELDFTAEDARLDDLAEILLGREDVEGGVDRLTLLASSRGGDLHTWVDNLDLELELMGGALSYGNATGERPVAFSIDESRVAVPAGGHLTGRVVGSLLENALTLQFEAGRARSYLDDVPWPIALEVEGPRARANLSGTLGYEGGEGSRLRLDFRGERLGELSDLLGVPATADAAFSFSGDLVGDLDDLEVQGLEARLGRSDVAGSLRLQQRGDDPFLDADLHFGVVDPVELDANLSAPVKDAAPGLTIDVPVLPMRIEILDVDARVRADRVAVEPNPFEQLAFEARIRDAGVDRAPFRVAYGGLDFSGWLALELGAEQPALRLRVGTDEADVGEFARQIGLAEYLDMSAGHVAVQIDSRGRTLRELVDTTSLEATLRRGRWVMEDPSLDGTLRLAVEEASITAPPGRPLVLEVDGSVDEIPVAIELETDTLTALLTSDQPDFPVRLHAKSAGAELELGARVELPITRRHSALDIVLRGELLEQLEPLLAVTLPPFGPYELRGSLDAAPGRYRSHFDLEIGESLLEGDVAMKAVEGRPVFDVDLDAKTIQLRDFGLGDWSPVEGDTGPTEADALLSPEVLRGFDADITLDVAEVRSGLDGLGSGSLVAEVKGGRLTVDPLHVAIPGGEIRVALAVEPGDQVSKAELRARVENLDYGILARRLSPDNDTDGMISLDIDLAGEAPKLARILQGSSGIMDVAIWPRNYKAGALEFWSVNLVMASLRALAPGSRDKLNCGVGAFDLTDGRLESREMLLDTTRIQVNGTGWADFRTERLEFELVPRPKRAQFLTLATPVVARGSFSDFRTLVTPEAAAGTLVRQATSVLTVPLSWIFSRSLPRDGSPICRELWEGVRREEP